MFWIIFFAVIAAVLFLFFLPAMIHYRSEIFVVLLLVIAVVVFISYFIAMRDGNYQEAAIVPAESVQDKYKQIPETQDDPFPRVESNCNSNECTQYAWYDWHNVSLAIRCYTVVMPNTLPCSEAQWDKALYGIEPSPEQKKSDDLEWCNKFAKDWNWTIEECLKQ